jgi:hypothetical protein
MSYLEKVIEELTYKPKISMTRLNEHGEDRPSNMQPETSRDLIAMSIRDLKMIKNDMRSHLDAMRQSRSDERLILQVEQEMDLMDGILERLARAAGMSGGSDMDDPESRATWTRQYNETK